MNQRLNTCSQCGQVIPPSGLLHELPPTKRKIFELVQRHPDISAERLRDLVWADDPNGGPECRHTIFVHVSQLNDLLASHGICVRSEGGGYRIRQVRP